MTSPPATLPTHPRPERSRPERERRPTPAMRGGIRAGQIAGIEIRIDVSMLVIAALITFNLGAGLLPAWHPDWPPALVWAVALIAAALFFASILAHELSHALVAKYYGLPVPRITLFVFGGMAEIGREPERPKVELLMAAAGPALSIALGGVLTLAGSFIGARELGAPPEPDTLHLLGPVSTILLWLGPINVLLGLFNLVPGFPLDGGRVLRAILWWRTKRLDTATRWATRGGQLVAGALVFAGIMMMFGYRVPVFGVGLGPGLWLVLIGWFLYSAAVRSYQQMLSQQALTGVSVAELMVPRVDAVRSDMPLSELERQLFQSEQRCFPVLSGDRLEGLVCLQDLRRVPLEAFRETPVSSVMTPLHRLAQLAPDTSATEALRLLAEYDVDQLPVLEQGRLLGFIRRRDLLRWIALRTGAPSELA